MIAAGDIMGYFTTVWIGDGRFRGTTVEFLAKTQQTKLHQNLMGSASSFSDGEKLVHLIRAVTTIAELGQIKTTAELLAASTGTTLSFGTYYSLLSSAAAQYDAGLQQKSKRMIYTHLFADHQEEEEHVNDYRWNNQSDDTYDIDSPVSYIEAKFTFRNKPRRNKIIAPPKQSRVFMPYPWRRLVEDARTVWDSLPDKDKAIIIGHIHENETSDRMKDQRS
jgi:hypothetical protein